MFYTITMRITTFQNSQNKIQKHGVCSAKFMETFTKFFEIVF